MNRAANANQPAKEAPGQPHVITPEEHQQEQSSGVVKKTDQHPEGEVVNQGAKPLDQQPKAP